MYEADKLCGFEGIWTGGPMRSIPIDVIRAFVAVVELRGFTRAAEDLGPFAADHQPAGEAARGAGRGAAVREGGAASS